MEQWYGLTQEEVLKRLSTNRTGLSEEEAEKRLEVYGENILKEQEEMPWWQIFLGQFKDLLVMILIGAAGVSMVTGDPESALVIFSVLLLNAVLGTVQHQKRPYCSDLPEQYLPAVKTSFFRFFLHLKLPL